MARQRLTKPNTKPRGAPGSAAPPRQKRAYNRRAKTSSVSSRAARPNVPVTDINLPDDPTRPKGAFTTCCSADDLIYPDAIYRSWEEFEEKFALWKAKYRHPFRVASSEALRTEYGQISRRFKYRYVVYHCARYGSPRKRGEGKRPNQNYLPCNCTAMIRLNFNYQDQTMRLTSLETRHSNHTVTSEFFQKMRDTSKRNLKVPRVEQEEDKDDDDDEDKEEELEIADPAPVAPAPAPTALSTESSNLSNVVVAKMEPVTVKPEIMDYDLQPPVAPMVFAAPRPLNDYLGFATAPAAPPPAPNADLLPYATNPLFGGNGQIQMLAGYNQNLQNQMMLSHINALHINALTNHWTSSSSSSLPMPLRVVEPTPESMATATTTTSRASSTADENEPPTFTPLETVRPVALRPSENSAFTRLLTSTPPKLEPPHVSALLGSTQQMLTAVDVAPGVLQTRVDQLSRLLAEWAHIG